MSLTIVLYMLMTMQKRAYGFPFKTSIPKSSDSSASVMPWNDSSPIIENQK